MDKKNHNLKIVIGLGKTGISVIKYLLKNESKILALDNKISVSALEKLKNEFPSVAFHSDRFDDAFLCGASEIIISPGVPLQNPFLQTAAAKKIPILGDIELFARTNPSPIIAITGSNGKSTVTTLVGEILQNSGKKVILAGNIGAPVLDHADQNPDYYVLELSSFQLETTYSLRPKIAVILNLSEDHLDRYQNQFSYLKAKLRIYNNASIKLLNNDDDFIQNNLPTYSNNNYVKFSPSNQKADFNINNNYICAGNTPLFPLNLKGKHNVTNALVATAICTSLGISAEHINETLLKFSGLPHRCQYLRRINEIDWYNDSKGTNVGATKSALESLGPTISGKIILIAGGIGKNADFFPLADVMAKYVKLTLLIGRDGHLIEATLKQFSNFLYATSIADAVKMAGKYASPGDLVILSPACASFDMFDNFEHRGKVFMDEVNKIPFE